MAFKQFKKQYFVTINTNGRIGFYAKFVRDYKIDGNTFISLFYDPDKNRIGFKFFPKHQEYSIMLKRMNNDNAYMACCKSFLAFCEYESTTKTQKFEIRYDKKSDMFVVQLPDNSPVTNVDIMQSAPSAGWFERLKEQIREENEKKANSKMSGV